MQDEKDDEARRIEREIRSQRKADLGDGTYRNPVLAGDRPDPTILRDGDEVVIGALAVLLQGGAMPASAVLTAAADIGEGIIAATGKPTLPQDGAVGGRHAHLEATVAVEQQRRCPIGFTGWPDQGLATDVMVHVGSLFAILVYFWRDVLSMVLGVGDLARRRWTDRARLLVYIAAATIPAILFGLLLKWTGLLN